METKLSWLPIHSYLVIPINSVCHGTGTIGAAQSENYTGPITPAFSSYSFSSQGVGYCLRFAEPWWCCSINEQLGLQTFYESELILEDSKHGGLVLLADLKGAAFRIWFTGFRALKGLQRCAGRGSVWFWSV